MAGNRDYTFVFWGKGFDELVASIFVVELRRRSLLVKVVGIGGSNLPGSCGLALVPDMPLDAALPVAGRARCVIVPCSYRHLTQLKNDPRIAEFLERAAQNNAWLVKEESGQFSFSAVCNKLFPKERILLYEHLKDKEWFAGLLEKIVECK